MWLPGSRRAPKREVVRRTPLPTARTRPCRRVSRVTIRSASPSLWTRRTTASSRYSGTGPWWHLGRTGHRFLARDAQDGAEHGDGGARGDDEQERAAGAVPVSDPADQG